MKYRYAAIVAVLALFVGHAALAGPFDIFKRPKRPGLTPVQVAPLLCSINVTNVTRYTESGLVTMSDDAAGPPMNVGVHEGTKLQIDYTVNGCGGKLVAAYFYGTNPPTRAGGYKWYKQLSGSGSLCFIVPDTPNEDDAASDPTLLRFAVTDSCPLGSDDVQCPGGQNMLNSSDVAIAVIGQSAYDITDVVEFPCGMTLFPIDMKMR